MTADNRRDSELEVVHWKLGATAAVIMDPTGPYIHLPEATRSLLVKDTGTVVGDYDAGTDGSTLKVEAGVFQPNGGGTVVGGAPRVTPGSFEWLGGTLNSVAHHGILDLPAESAWRPWLALDHAGRPRLGRRRWPPCPTHPFSFQEQPSREARREARIIPVTSVLFYSCCRSVFLD